MRTLEHQAPNMNQATLTRILSIAAIVATSCGPQSEIARPTDRASSALTAPALPPEPVIPPACTTLLASKSVVNRSLATADESNPDTSRIQAAIDSCGAGKSVRLVTSGSFNAFLAGPLTLAAGVTLWVDGGVTLFASRNPRDFDVSSGSCGTDANDSSSGCKSLINVGSVSGAGVMGQGVIDGRGGELMIGSTQTWWDVAQDAKTKGVSHSNPRLIDVKGATSFTLYEITLHNSPKFHVGLQANGFVVWGVNLLTPASSTSSTGKALTPVYARNTDGIDPSAASNGYIVYSNISVGDDQIAIKGGSGPTSGIVVAHNWFGTGHGMSIGSETNAGVSNVTVYDLAIDGTIPTGGAASSDVNGIRIKSDASRGGLVTGITYSDVCMRGLVNPIILNPRYSSSSGSKIPSFQNITLNDVRQVAASGVTPVVTLDGYDSSHLSTVTLNNVVVDGITSGNVKAAYATVTLGPDPVNFTASGTSVTVKNDVTTTAAPNPCTNRFVQVTPPGSGSNVTLTIGTSGTGTTSPAAGTYTYAPGSTVSVTATPASGYSFTGWSGAATGTANPIAVTVNASETLTATFAPVSSGGSSILQEGTTGFCGGEGSIATSNAGSTGAGSANISNSAGKGINWSVSAPSAGTYHLTFRYENSGSSVTTTAAIQVNGATVYPTATFPLTASKTTWTTVSFPVTLQAGVNAIRLEATSGTEFANIDYLQVDGGAAGAPCS